MIIVLVHLVFLGFYFLYNTSKKAKLNKTKIDVWLQNHIKITKFFGILLLIIAFILSVIIYGIGAGVFVAFIMLMTIGSLIIVLAPLFTKH